MTNPSKQMYDSLHKAFDHFNKTLFGGELPPVILVVHRKRNAHGYFWAEQWNAKDGEDKLPEIALNPETMGRDEKEVLSTLVHEMVHHQQESFGTPPKTAYHNKEWADMMEAVGLIPTTTGERGGPRTGRNCTHVIDEGGVFDVGRVRQADEAEELRHVVVRAPAGEGQEAGPHQGEAHLPFLPDEHLGEARHQRRVRGLRRGYGTSTLTFTNASGFGTLTHNSCRRLR